MNWKPKGLLGIMLALLLILGGCAQPGSKTGPAENRLNVVATTTMLADLSGVIGGEHVAVSGLMGPGIDPHLYQAGAGDVTLMQQADVVVYNGLHLEGKMGEIFESLSGQGHAVICLEAGLDEAKLLRWDGGGSVYDPHIWFNVSLWQEAARIVAEGFSQADPGNTPAYQANLANYLRELEALDAYIRARAAELPAEQRVLVTAHDAFNYFGNAYGFEVRGLQGISTDAEAGTADVSALADFIAERKIKAIFVESSVPPKTIQALQAAVRAKGFDVAIGGELYSDSLGGENSGAQTYILTVRANIDAIVEALQ
ncbi:periplasmic solute binding protein [Syntrophobotulus glycolicus DSM 8271]|uniref:Periplasmic solute binding protein n=1 Tax=Syntrophobotulus glycolicus (strain DSM 8271 / FlGlyR) TaxID=645991 RepID=F0SX15_SYNGF|nr:zinc ABC transporter substrate-binding protein [Syntrophobotulus glycolicus]ADY55798.1 periplasmic solute binding protein [Syntrophobotulus glycolicus DSM 8271]